MGFNPHLLRIRSGGGPAGSVGSARGMGPRLHEIFPGAWQFRAVKRFPLPLFRSAPRRLRSWWLLAGLSAVAGLGCPVLVARQSLARPTLTSQRLIVLAYHDVAEPGDAVSRDFAITPRQFADQLVWLRQNGYHPVSIQQILQARSTGEPLPANPVLISFDDGYRSVFTNVYPLLQRYQVPAVVSVVGRWLEPQSGPVQYGDGSLDRTAFLSWPQLRQMQASGLVDVASHSYDLHRGITGNPQGNSEPAATTRQFLGRDGYESEASYRQRLHDDLARNSALIQRQLGRRPRVIAWPYGRYNAVAIRVAEQLGMPIGLSLDDGANADQRGLTALRRILVGPELASVKALARELTLRRLDADDSLRAAKVMHVDLDAICDPDPAQTERNLRLLLARIDAMGVNTVYLQAFADPDGDGTADALYFPNRSLPVRADLFNHVAWEIRIRTRVRRLYAWMPVLAFALPAGSPAAADQVITQPNHSGHAAMGYRRLSPFSSRAMAVVESIYADLGRRASFDGVLFHDDVTLTDYEDASPAALRQYKSWGLPTDLALLRKSDALLGRWTTLKTQYLDQLTMRMAARLRQDQPQLRTARNLYAQVVLNPHAEAWFSQSLDTAVKTYDFTAIEAMPFMEKAEDPRVFLRQMVARVSRIPDGLRHVVFELQSTDWAQRRDLPSRELAGQMQELYGLGVRHLGYYPDNPFRGTPEAAVIRPVLDARASAP